jgi:hypothetical protein
MCSAKISVWRPDLELALFNWSELVLNRASTGNKKAIADKKVISFCFLGAGILCKMPNIVLFGFAFWTFASEREIQWKSNPTPLKCTNRRITTEQMYLYFFVIGSGGREVTYGRSLEWHLKYFGLVDGGVKAITISEWETLAQDRAGWLKLVTKAPFNAIGKPQLRPPRCDTR